MKPTQTLTFIKSGHAEIELDMNRPVSMDIATIEPLTEFIKKYLAKKPVGTVVTVTIDTVLPDASGTGLRTT